MGKRLALAVLVVLAVALAPLARADEEAKPIALREATLANGLRLVVDSNARVPLVTVLVAYRVGSAEDPPGRAGLADLTTTLMGQHTQHVPRGEMRRELDRYASSWSYDSGVDSTTFSATVEPNAVERMLWLFSDGMGYFEGALDQADVDHELSTMKSDRSEVEDASVGLATGLLRKELYPVGHPYRRLGENRVETLAHIRAPEIAAFHARWFVPRNASLIFAGDIAFDDALRLATKYFATLPAGPAHGRLVVPEVRLKGQTELDFAAPVQAARLVMCWPTPAEFASGDAELDSVSGLLDGDRIAQLRWELDSNKHLVTRIDAAQESDAQGSLFVITATIAGGHAAREVIDGIDSVLRDLQNTPQKPEDVAASVLPLLGRRVFSFETARGRAYKYAKWLRTVGQASYMREDFARYDSLSPQTVQQAARTLLPLDRRVIAVVEPDASAPVRGVLKHRTFTPAAAP